MFFSKNKIFLLVFVFFTTLAQGQDSLNSAIVEQKSYQLYLEKNWKELIQFGNKALKSGYDYFYLQMRIGIAYYERKNYCLAEPHFKKALAYNSGDELAREYIYYCLLFTAKYDQAKLFSKSFSKDLAVKTSTVKKNTLDFLTIEGGTKISDSASYYDVARKSESNYFNPATYLQIGLGHTIQKSVSLFHALTYFDQTNFIGEVKQSQYYLRGAVPLKNNWLISPAFHDINLNFTEEGKPIPSRPASPMGPPIQTQATRPSTVTTSNYFVGSLTIQKNYKKIGMAVGSTYSNMFGITQILNNGFLAYSVFGNNNLVLGCTGYLHTTDSYKVSYISAVPFIYVQPSKIISLKASYLVNTGNNIIEDNGYLVNNSTDLTNSRWSLLANISISKYLTLYGLYQLENKTENVQGFNYKYNIIVGGLKITP